MIGLATLLLLGQSNAELPPLPLSPAEPLLSYVGCLMEPAAEGVRAGLPADRPSREAAAQEILASCASVRRAVASAAFHRSESLPSITDQQARRDLIEAYLQRFESGMRHMIVEFEAFAAESDAFCRERGEPPGC